MNISLARYVRKGFDNLVENAKTLKWGFDCDQASMFSGFIPENDEINIANNYDGEIDDLDEASKYVYFFKDVPAFE
jgi:hypothetical protein